MFFLIIPGKHSQEYNILYAKTFFHHPFHTLILVIDLAKISPHILDPELFALHLGTHFVSKYAHIHKAFITIEKLRWSRIQTGPKGQEEPHAHSFYRDGDDKWVTKVEVGDNTFTRFG